MVATTFDRKQTFPLNVWDAVAWGVEVTRALLGRTVCGCLRMMTRKSDGPLVAPEDAYGHHPLPLSNRWRDGGDLGCGYHGLLDTLAECCEPMPAQATGPPAARVKKSPLEKNIEKKLSASPAEGHRSIDELVAKERVGDKESHNIISFFGKSRVANC